MGGVWASGGVLIKLWLLETKPPSAGLLTNLSANGGVRRPLLTLCNSALVILSPE
jgi:hypothetical protein